MHRADESEPCDPLLINAFDYDLPEDLIAQSPVEPRDSSRLLVLNRQRDVIEHRVFRDVIDYVGAGDLLVVNDSRVLPARLRGKRPTGGSVEILLLRRLADGRWQSLVRPGRRLRPGAEVRLADTSDAETDQIARIVERVEGGEAVVELPAVVEERLEDFGEMPLPPYIHQRLEDPERYQTIYAHVPGSAAAPTAGLHFTPELLERLREKGVGVAEVTLHVGVGTFLPVKVDDARRHTMHAEWFHVPTTTMAAIRETKARAGRVVAVGTTSCRTLESIDLDDADQTEASGWTRLFITPGFEFGVVDAMVTNFHLPRSTLMLLVSAFAERERILNAYREAIARRYRFFSFGDAMLIV